MDIETLTQVLKCVYDRLATASCENEGVMVFGVSDLIAGIRDAVSTGTLTGDQGLSVCVQLGRILEVQS